MVPRNDRGATGASTAPHGSIDIEPEPEFAEEGPMKSPSTDGPRGRFEERDGETWYTIDAVDELAPFLCSVVSDRDLWMFLSSRGGLTAGRVDPDGAIFPYLTADRLHSAASDTGPATYLRIEGGADGPQDWTPFHPDAGCTAGAVRRFRRHRHATQFEFEAEHPRLELLIRARWSPAGDLGWARRVEIENRSSLPLRVRGLDGLRNLLPPGAPLRLHQQSSCLIDAYKRLDRDPASSLAILSLTSAIVDRAEAVESPQAAVVWSAGDVSADIRLGADALRRWQRGEEPLARLLGQRLAYWNVVDLALAPGQSASWFQVVDTGLDAAAVADLQAFLREVGDPLPRIRRAVLESTDHLASLVEHADGRQTSAHPMQDIHHEANVLFNILRGGVLPPRLQAPRSDFEGSLGRRDRRVARRHERALSELPSSIDLPTLRAWADSQEDPDLRRLALEYLPIYFGRRHGDPSRPWNLFAIHVRDEQGRPRLHFEGNWRDLFQNWEALAESFPSALPGMIARFVNASTADGFNPYRITSDGVEWEVEDPEDPWSTIGYWGDHQIIYLLDLLESLHRHDPGALARLLAEEIFVHTDVPYRLRSFDEIFADPRHTIDYDADRAERIAARVEEIGEDGKLLAFANGDIAHVSFLEKLLVPVLAKLSNLVPPGGIWMNTQRPEWNDANNALVGNGSSVVTMAYLRRHLRFLEARFREAGEECSARISTRVRAWMEELEAPLEDLDPHSMGDGDDQQRYRLFEAWGRAYETYRQSLYSEGPDPGLEELRLEDVADFCAHFATIIELSLHWNRRSDGLYHAYNLLEVGVDTQGGPSVAVRPLHEMLEGQVAILRSGIIDPASTLELIDRLFESPLYREDQRSFLLYPIHHRPEFSSEHTLETADVEAIPLLRSLLEAEVPGLIRRDGQGGLHFEAGIRRASDVSSALDRLATDARWHTSVERDRAAVLQLFERHYGHREFTGRSGRMYGYEGIGCIYWHMVAKLLVAVQEAVWRAHDEGTDPTLRDGLIERYYRIRAGLGFEKTVREYGAFPMDPYSHTPLHAGAQQPGMTGQVKEEIRTRAGELGVRVLDGRVVFEPIMLRRTEFLNAPREHVVRDLDDQQSSLELGPGELAFAIAQVPVIYRLGESPRTEVFHVGGEVVETTRAALDSATSRSIFERRGEIALIRVTFPPDELAKA